MPRRQKRFGKLYKAYREAGGVADPATRLGKFKEWATGKVKIDVTRRPDAAMMKRQLCKVIPFGVTPGSTATPADYYLTAITGQARAIYTGLGGDNTVFGLEICTSNNDSSGASDDGRFYPALARLFVHAANATVDSETSKVTGDRYKRKKGRAGSIPFGRNTATETKDAKTGAQEASIGNADERDVAESILVTCKKVYTAFNVATITFVPEQFNPDTAVQLAPSGVGTLNLN